jgi:hypothetical protein
METGGGPLLIQHGPAASGPGWPASRRGRWILTNPGEQGLSVPLRLDFHRRSVRRLLAPAVAAQRHPDPSALPGILSVDSHGPGESVAARVQPLAMTAGDVPRRALLSHPTSHVILDPVTVPRDAQLELLLGLDQRAGDQGSDGVTFRVLLSGEDGPQRLLLERHLDPAARPAERAWLAETVDLAAFAGVRGSFVLETLPGPAGQTAFDWSAWAAVDLAVPAQPVPASLCHVEEGRALDPERALLELPRGGNVTLRLAEPRHAEHGVRLALTPASRGDS